MEIIVKVTDAELAEMKLNQETLCGWISGDIDLKEYGCKYLTVEVINTDNGKHVSKTTKDHLAIKLESLKG